MDILIHKGSLIAAAIEGLMGRDKVIEFLALLRQRHGGGTFVLGDFIAAMAETDTAMARYIEHLLRESSLPGFLVSDLRVVRLPDLESGEPRYQVSLTGTTAFWVTVDRRAAVVVRLLPLAN